MSTTTGPNLDAAKRAVERLMDDTCTIRRPRADADRVLDRGTGEVTAPSRPPYYDGPCMVKAVGSPGENYAGGNEKVYLRYEVTIPLTDNIANEPEPGDIVDVTTSRRDFGLVGLRLRVMSAEFKTFAISRKMQCELYVVPADEP